MKDSPTRGRLWLFSLAIDCEPLNLTIDPRLHRIVAAQDRPTLRPECFGVLNSSCRAIVCVSPINQTYEDNHAQKISEQFNDGRTGARDAEDSDRRRGFIPISRPQR